MLLKPRNSVMNEKAKVFKRYLSLEEVRNKRLLYKTSDEKYWMFDYKALDFIETTYTPGKNIQVREILNGEQITYYLQAYGYSTRNGWNLVENPQNSNVEKLPAEFGNVANFQTNKYYFVGYLDYIIKGSVEGTATQWIKGNLLPLNSFNIQYYDDNMVLEKDDLVVIGDRLFQVEDTEAVQKRQPKPYFVYNSTLNNILK